jgi:hypothetical protein
VLKKKESVDFHELLIMHKEAVIAANEITKIQGEDKVKASKLMEINS